MSDDDGTPASMPPIRTRDDYFLEQIYILLQGGPMHGHTVRGFRFDGHLAESHTAFTDHGTAAIYLPVAPNDSAPVPVFTFDHEVPIHGHPLSN